MTEEERKAKIRRIIEKMIKLGIIEIVPGDQSSDE